MSKRTFKLRVVRTVMTEQTFYIYADSREEAESRALEDSPDEVDVNDAREYPNVNIDIFKVEQI